MTADPSSAASNIDRYELIGELATGGMATVYLGRQRGPFGFARTVAIKSMHPQFAKDEGFRAMFLDEATLTAKIRHPNVVPTLDIVCTQSKVLLVMEYIDGVSLSMLLRVANRRGKSLPPAVVVAIMADVLHGLHAAHELTADDGQPLSVVHRDVSPQNIHVGVDGMARVLDFGVAKAASRRYVTQSGEVKGKITYMSSEQLCGEPVDRRTDIYAAGVVLWEALANQRLIASTNEGEVVKKVIEGKFDPPSFIADEPLSEALDRVVMKALALKSEDRFATAEEMAHALTNALPPATRNVVTSLVRELASTELSARSARLREEGTPISKKLEPEEKAVLEVLTEHATVTNLISTTGAPAITRGRRGDASVWTARVIAIGVGLLLLVGVTSVAFILGSRSARTTTNGTSTAPPQPGPELSAVKDPSVPSGTPVVPTSGATLNTEAPPSSPATPATPSAVATVKKPVTTKKSGTPPSGGGRTKSTKDCNPPYVVDANGDRHYKPECVE